jgi:hypothetical protein
MPFKPPPRDLSNVRCVKRTKDKNGDEKKELQVLFDPVREDKQYTMYNVTHMVCQEYPKWDLNKEIITDMKEIFIMFNTDQVKGLCRGNRTDFVCRTAC